MLVVLAEFKKLRLGSETLNEINLKVFKMRKLKIVERVILIIMLLGFIGVAIPAFVQGYNDGLNGVTSSAKPSVFFYNLWTISTLFFFIIKVIRYKFK